MVGRAAIILRAKEDEMDRCSGCGGSLTTAGCINPACMSGPGGYYRDGVKVAPAAGPPPPLGRTLGDVADDLRGSAQVARRAIASAIGIGTFRDEAASELAQAVVLLNRAAARFDLVCGLEDVQFTKTRD